MVRTVIFDFDGTLADTCSGIIKAMQATLEAMGFPPASDHDIKVTIGLPVEECFRQLGIPEDRIDEGRETYRTLFNELALPEVRFFPMVKETLSAIREMGIRLAIATSRGIRSLGIILNSNGAAEMFDAMTTASGNWKPKPSPDMVLYLLDALGAKAEETIVVGDTTFDLEMGKSAGCLTCGVTYGNHGRTMLETACPDYIMDSMDELLGIIK